MNDVALSSEACAHPRLPLSVFAVGAVDSVGRYLVSDAALYRRFVFVLIHRSPSQMVDLPASQRNHNAALPPYNRGSSISSLTVFSMEGKSTRGPIRPKAESVAFLPNGRVHAKRLGFHHVPDAPSLIPLCPNCSPFTEHNHPYPPHHPHAKGLR